jgi:hypothetical protein
MYNNLAPTKLHTDQFQTKNKNKSNAQNKSKTHKLFVILAFEENASPLPPRSALHYCTSTTRATNKGEATGTYRIPSCPNETR